MGRHGFQLKMWLYQRLGGRQSFSFFGPASERHPVRDRLDALLAKVILGVPRQRRISPQVPPALRNLPLPEGFEVLGTFAEYDRRRKVYDRVEMKYRWADSVDNGWPVISRALFDSLEINPNSFESGFSVNPHSFLLDENWSITMSQDGGSGIRLYIWEIGEPQPRDPTQLPLLGYYWSDQIKEVGRGGIKLPTQQRPDAEFERWCGIMRSEGWQEVGRLSAEWGVLAQFARAEQRQSATLTLTRAADGEWAAAFDSLTLPGPPE